MELHQIQLTYQPEEDRVLWRTSFRADDGSLQEIRAWLTRRMTGQLWGGLVEVMERQVALDKPHAAHARSDIVGMEHHASVDAMRESGSFGSAFQEDVAGFPLGAAPFLVTTVNFGQEAGKPIRMNLVPTEGHGFEVALPAQVLHGFCSLLRDAVAKADWDLELELPGASAPGGGVLN
ncbi:MAG TPA: hypothetical protein VEC01_08965 [Noviherbaspirillum sp.]|uniref:hypothetical protein n=1 Tax=Noviherbaspirillum sp. TaxID=1926288 RepID=UPI002D6074F8|nr:hypothetical protein [Noviherbaspirillum sp.]HYD95443.1 hypothetical protein [Noviherbaspirillum sp.]